jgi:hypothetical protein
MIQLTIMLMHDKIWTMTHEHTNLAQLRPGEPGYGLPPVEHTYRLQDESRVTVADGGAHVVTGAVYDETELSDTFRSEPRPRVPRYETNSGRAEALAYAADSHMVELQEAKRQRAIYREKSMPSGGRVKRLGKALLGGIPKVDPDLPAEYYESPLRVGRLQHTVDEAERKAALEYDNRPERLIRDDNIIGPFYMEPGQIQTVRLEPSPDSDGYRATSVETRPDPHVVERIARS